MISYKNLEMVGVESTNAVRNPLKYDVPTLMEANLTDLRVRTIYVGMGV